MHDLEASSLVLGLGFLVDRPRAILEGGELLDESEPSKVLTDTADRLEWIYLTGASELAFRRTAYLDLSLSGLKDDIQKVAHGDARMASEMVERAVKTLKASASCQEVSEGDVEHTKKLLEYVSRGALAFVQRLQEH